MFTYVKNTFHYITVGVDDEYVKTIRDGIDLIKEVILWLTIFVVVTSILETIWIGSMYLISGFESNAFNIVVAFSALFVAVGGLLVTSELYKLKENGKKRIEKGMKDL